MRPVSMIALLALLAVAVAADASAAGPERARIEITARVFADSQFRDGRAVKGRFAVIRAHLPIMRLARRVLAEAGIAVANDNDAEAGDAALLTIEIEAVALGQSYDFMARMQRNRNLRFVGARVVGTVTWREAGSERTCVARFAGAVVPRRGIPAQFGRDWRERPAYAPFDKAMTAPGSLADALRAVMVIDHRPSPDMSPDTPIAVCER